MSKKLQIRGSVLVCLATLIIMFSGMVQGKNLADQLREANKAINQQRHAESKVSSSKSPFVAQDDDDYFYDGYIPLKIPFTDTERYNYYDQFLQGLQLENYFDHASECIDANFYTLDDYAYY